MRSGRYSLRHFLSGIPYNTSLFRIPADWVCMGIQSVWLIVVKIAGTLVVDLTPSPLSSRATLEEKTTCMHHHATRLA